MQFLQSLEAFFFANILELQNSKMQSQFAFLIAMAFKFIFKDGFILLFLLLPINITNALLQKVVQECPNYDVAITVAAFLLVLAVLLSRVNGVVRNNKVREMALQVLPWCDILTFPVLMVLFLLIAKSTSPILAALNIMTAILFSIVQITYNLINFTKTPKSNNLFHCRQARVSLLANAILLFFCYYMLARWSQGSTFGQTEKLVYCLLLLGLTSIKIKERILLKYSVNPFAQHVSSFAFFLELNLHVIAVAQSISQIDLITTNLPYLLLVMTVLSYYSRVTYITWRESEFYLSSATEMKGEDEATLYLDCLEQLARKVQNKEEDIILISLRTRHEMVCSCPKCFCNFAGKELSPFIREYIKCELNTLAEQFPNSPSILISILYFKMVMFKFYPEILTKLNEYKNKFNLTVLQRFYNHWLIHYVKGYISKRNREIAAVESEHMFKLEALREEMETIIRSEVEVRQKKWRYLSRGLCRIEELEDQCEAELNYIQRMLRIYEENKAKFKKSKQFNLLMLFYFLKVSFLHTGKDLKTNLKEIYYGFKIDELRSLKEFKKFIYHKSSCAVETMIDTKSMGIITTASRNVEDMFGIPPEKIKGASINSIMPEFMGAEHENIMLNWAKTGTWHTIGKLKQIYCVHKEQYCFAALLYLKVYVRDNSLYFITNIFKLNDADYLILSPEGRIQGLGRKFMKVLGEEAKFMPIHLLIETSGVLPEKEEFQLDKPYSRVFMGLKGVEDMASQFLEREGNLITQEEKEQHCNEFYHNLKSACTVKYFVEFVVQSYKMGKINFPVIQIRQSRAIEKHKTIYFLNRSLEGINSMREHLGEDLEVDMESERKSEASKNDDEDQGAFENMANSSMASTNQKENYPLSKMVDKFVELLMDPTSLSDRRINRFTFVFFILISILGALNFLSYYFYRQLLLEVEGVFFADGAVSDIMQTTEIAYAHVYQLRSQLLAGKFSDFQSQIRSARYVQSYVQGLKEYSFSHLLTDRTGFTGKRLYGYIQKPALWIQSNNVSVEVDTYQFLQHMYYLTNEMVNQLQTLKQNNLTSIDTGDLQKMISNFPEMQTLNEYYLLDYYQSAENSHLYLNYLTIGSMVLFALLSMVIACVVNNYFKFRFYQAEDSFKFLSLIPNQLVERMKEYYSGVSRKVLQVNLLKNIDQHEDQVFSVDTHDIGKVDLTKISSASKIKLINYSTYYRWIILGLLCLGINGFNYLATSDVRNIFGPSKVVIELVNALMRGENRLLQSYFDLKADYYLNNPKGLNLDFFNQVQSHLDGAGDKWSSYANQLSSLLISYSPQYQDQFRAALTTNICDLTADVLPDYESAKCRDQLYLNMLDGGIMISMNFFRRTVQEAIATLKAQYALQTQSVYPGDYFLKLDFTQLDKMQIYMFKIYQLTQEVCYQAFIHIIDVITNAFLLFAIIFVLMYAAFILIWAYVLSSQKKKLSRIYARLVLVPFGILRSNVRIVNSFKEATEYNEN